jgi:septation ring formation regulator EzrA
MPSSKPRELHELREAYNDFRMTLKLIQTGYKFDDSDAKKVMLQLEKALDTFQQHIQYLEKNRQSPQS